jgi:hypothetical protein
MPINIPNRRAKFQFRPQRVGFQDSGRGQDHERQDADPGWVQAVEGLRGEAHYEQDHHRHGDSLLARWRPQQRPLECQTIALGGRGSYP